LGTEDAMMEGALAGAAFVVLNSAVTPAGLNANEIGIELHWKMGPTGKDLSSQFFAEKIATGGIRALTPLAPVHLAKQVEANGDAGITWIRRGRLDADNWLAAEIPLGEASEAYRIRILNAAGAKVREASATGPHWIWTNAMQASDGPLNPVSIEITQMSEVVGLGIPALLLL
jgi:hypothetical protein